MTPDEVGAQAWAQVGARPRRPGATRLAISGFMHFTAGVLALWSLALALVGVPPLDFTFGFVTVASHLPGPLTSDVYPVFFVLNGVLVAPLLGLIVLVPLGVAGIVGAMRVWGGGDRRLTMLVAAGWLALAVALAAAGGDWALVPIAGAFFAVAFSGAWAGRRDGSSLPAVLARGE